MASRKYIMTYRLLCQQYNVVMKMCEISAKGHVHHGFNKGTCDHIMFKAQRLSVSVFFVLLSLSDITVKYIAGLLALLLLITWL